jgi:magnesium-transporting ATPase (P-type)
MICADMIIFGTGNTDGSVYISTSSLDGEKTLKTKVFLNLINLIRIIYLLKN